jgi:hypothetical protein
VSDTQTTVSENNRRLLNRTGSAVALLLLVILSVALWATMTVQIPAENHDILLFLITTVGNAVIGVTSCFFGSSVAQDRQGDIIATQAVTASKLADTAAAVQATIQPHNGGNAP